VQQSVTDWLTAELTKVASAVTSDTIKCEVLPASIEGELRAQTGPHSMYRPISGMELTVDDANDPSNRKHELKFYLCRHSKVVVTIHNGRPPPPSSEPPENTELAILPVYSSVLKHDMRNRNLGYVSKKDQIGKGRTRIFSSAPIGAASRRLIQPEHYRVNHIAWTFEKDDAVHIGFRATEWPRNEDEVRAMLEEAIEVFFGHLSL
jgi:hypothetical protein